MSEVQDKTMKITFDEDGTLESFATGRFSVSAGGLNYSEEKGGGVRSLKMACLNDSLAEIQQRGGPKVADLKAEIDEARTAFLKPGVDKARAELKAEVRAEVLAEIEQEEAEKAELERLKAEKVAKALATKLAKAKKAEAVAEELAEESKTDPADTTPDAVEGDGAAGTVQVER